MRKPIAVVLALALAGLVASVAASPRARAASVPTLPSHAAIVSAGKLALDYYGPTYAPTTLTPKNGWSWGTYFEGVQDLYRHAGDARYQSDGMAWGGSTSWVLDTSETDPDTVKAGQDYYALHQVDPAASLASADARMTTDLASLPLSRYDWIDSLFMGLPSWALWSTRTGDAAYLNKLDALFRWTRDQGATSSRCAGKVLPQAGLLDAGTGLWYRDCTFVGATDVNGQRVFWSRGNGWVIAAMADVLRSLPAGDPRAAAYTGMLRTMAAGLVARQGADGFWRASLADATLFPQPETSGTALITYALAYGVRAGVLDSATYLPVVARAWQGLSTTALRPSGFLTDCQAPGVSPAAPYTASAPRTAPTATSSGTVNVDSPPYCVGAFLMAAGQVAQLVPNLSTGRPVTATAQETGNEAPRAVDGDVTTRWSAAGFPQSVTVDLGVARSIGSTMVVPYLDRAYRYRIESSTDNATWRLLVDGSANVSPGSRLDDFAAVTARYVRLTVVGVSADPTTWVSIQEFTVHPPPVAAPVTTYAADTFTRTVTNGLGTAEKGGAWTVTGSTADYSVSGGVARLRMALPAATRTASLPSLPAADVTATVDVSFNKVATGGGTYVALAARRTGTSDYRLKVKKVPSGAVTLSLVKVVGGAETVLASRTISGLVLGTSDTLRMRLLVSGSATTTLSAKAWKTTTAEPGTWQLTAADGTPQLQVPGGLLLSAYLSGTATNAPLTASFDNLSAVG